MSHRQPVQRYNRRMVILSLAYVALLFVALISIERYKLAGPLAYIVAVLPALTIIGMFVVIGRYLIEEKDEFLRLLAARQTLVASGFALSIATAWGFLQSFKLVGQFDAYWVVVIWFTGLGLGATINKLSCRQDR